MAAKEYKIKVTNEIVGLENGGGQSQIDNGTSEPAQNQNAKAVVKKSASGGVGKAVAVNMGKQAFSYATSNYGNLTGDYIGQANISEGFEIAGLIAMAATGWIGAAAAIGAIGVKAVNRFVDVRKSEVASANMRERTGLSKGGSR